MKEGAESQRSMHCEMVIVHSQVRREPWAVRGWFLVAGDWRIARARAVGSA
jgi:hypothetical protein